MPQISPSSATEGASKANGTTWVRFHLRLDLGGQLPTVAAKGEGQRRTKPATGREAHRNQEHIALCPFVVWALFQQSLPCLPWVWTSTRPDAFALAKASHPGKVSVRCHLLLHVGERGCRRVSSW